LRKHRKLLQADAQRLSANTNPVDASFQAMSAVSPTATRKATRVNFGDEAFATNPQRSNSENHPSRTTATRQSNQ
jgi:hypothetical protein